MISARHILLLLLLLAACRPPDNRSAVSTQVAATAGALRQGSLPALLRRNGRVLAATALLLWLVEVGVNELPREVTLADLPPEATPAHLIYDGTLELVGWRVREQYSPRNSILPFRPWVVSLYWRLLQPADVDYSFSLKYFIGDRAVIAFDRPLGYVAHPRDFSSDWQVGPVYVEHVGLSYRSYDGPLEQTGRVVLDVYPERNPEAGLDPHNVKGERQGRPVLARPAILLPPGRNEVTVDGPEVAFGEALRLLGVELPARAAPGERVAVRSACPWPAPWTSCTSSAASNCAESKTRHFGKWRACC